MKIEINIQSYSDIITNSSSELFIINTQMDIEIFDDIWTRELKRLGYQMDDWSWDTYHGTIYRDDKQDKLIISFPVMCNLDNEAYYWLDDLFGKENINYG